MTYKWNPADAENYAKAFGSFLSDEYFQSKDKISGAELLKFSEIKQLNLFVLKQLYAKWQEENARLKSPFFNYDDEEVKKALDALMNVLSRNISIGKEAFESLLTKATFEVLQLCMEPRAHFEVVFRNLPDFKLTAEWLQENEKYYVIHKHVFQQLQARLSDKTVFANEAITWLSDLTFEQTQENTTDILDDFDKIKPLLLKKEQPGKSFFEDLLKEQEVPFKNEIPLREPVKTVESRVNNLPKEPVTVTTTAAVVETPTLKKVEMQRLNERHGNASKTLNEKIISSGKSLLDVHQKRKIASLKEGISLNQRFLFINHLFGGDQQAFSMALDELEQFQDLNQARNHADHQLAVKYRWEQATDEAQEFYAHLERKFS